MTELQTIILGLILSAILICIIDCIVNYFFYRAYRENNQVISFNAFKNLYNIAPLKWRVTEKEYAEYLYEKAGGRERICMKTFMDYIRYYYFVRSLKKKKERDEYNEITKRMVSCWQKDIDTYRENAQKEIDDLVSRIEK